MLLQIRIWKLQIDIRFFNLIYYNGISFETTFWKTIKIDPSTYPTKEYLAKKRAERESNGHKAMDTKQN